MEPTSSQFPDREPKSNNIPKKIKSSGGSNPYKQLNQMLDFQIKQEKLEDLKKKKPAKTEQKDTKESSKDKTKVVDRNTAKRIRKEC